MPTCKHRVRIDIWGRTQLCKNTAIQDGYCGIHHPDSAKARQERRMQRLAEQHYQAMRMDAYRFINKASVADLNALLLRIKQRLKELPGVSLSDIS